MSQKKGTKGGGENKNLTEFNLNLNQYNTVSCAHLEAGEI